ncbi:hypothetical protein GIB67_035193 [Kingdonia uniflora]|uniref:B30.2/SPRY domain-containing protein n=1 Tax=Kingdonia uniflora TaxID=39325 RepID=A0A7J7LDN3_9MAGN|nr:hypothetical protein GIB67_035193 [Kingdonia uniflora]
METLRDTYINTEEESEEPDVLIIDNPITTTTLQINNNPSPQIKLDEHQDIDDEVSEEDLSDDNNNNDNNDDDDDDEDYDEGGENTENASKKKQKSLSLSSFTETMQLGLPIESSQSPLATPTTMGMATPSIAKKPKKKTTNKSKTNSVWTKPAYRKGKKRSKSSTPNGNTVATAVAEDKVLITPIPRFPDRTDDSPDAKICLSKVYKAEKVELSEDRLSAGSSKGYRMVRATRGITEGSWYFEIRVSKLGGTGHTRLGWTMEKGDLQAPVGYDGNSFGYRDIDGSKVRKGLREKYGEEGYVEGDVIGCYVSLPEGDLYQPKPPHFVWYKGQKYMCAAAADGKEEAPKVIPGE